MVNELRSEKTYCPYCGEIIELLIDVSESSQSYIEDCQVCCRPISVAVHVDEFGAAAIMASGEDEA